MPTKKLHNAFFDAPANTVAKQLIGTFLCVRTNSETRKFLITETEAYMGPHDLASHASKGKTARTDVMFRKPGTIYVYLIYGMYEMFNIVTGPEGYPAAVLVRGVQGIDGPGKLTKALGITPALNGATLGHRSGVWVEIPDDYSQLKRKIITTPRIGVQYAKEWKEKKLRFVLNSRRRM